MAISGYENRGGAPLSGYLLEPGIDPLERIRRGMYTVPASARAERTAPHDIGDDPRAEGRTHDLTDRMGDITAHGKAHGLPVRGTLDKPRKPYDLGFPRPPSTAGLDSAVVSPLLREPLGVPAWRLACCPSAAAVDQSLQADGQVGLQGGGFEIAGRQSEVQTRFQPCGPWQFCCRYEGIADSAMNARSFELLALSVLASSG
ncbi:hypothetical protein ACIA8E_21280 [Streptomyces sp. NPDC051664]|uniref:hypothetical protein n=1 Tax=Streptomyces sp. NPDC051664 TaxID=3365668 RepID=UPI0037A3A7F1